MSDSQAMALATAMDSGPRQLLTFLLGEESFGVDILRVREIRGWSPVTKIPHSPEEMLGVLNLRGSIVPIIDLRRQFRLARADYDAMTVIIVLTVESSAGRQEVGVVVDGVSEVVDVDVASLRPAPDLGACDFTHFVSGLMPVADRMVILLDADRLLGAPLAAAA